MCGSSFSAPGAYQLTLLGSISLPFLKACVCYVHAMCMLCTCYVYAMYMHEDLRGQSQVLIPRNVIHLILWTQVSHWPWAHWITKRQRDGTIMLGKVFTFYWDWYPLSFCQECLSPGTLHHQWQLCKANSKGSSRICLPVPMSGNIAETTPSKMLLLDFLP